MVKRWCFILTLNSCVRPGPEWYGNVYWWRSTCRASWGTLGIESCSLSWAHLVTHWHRWPTDTQRPRQWWTSGNSNRQLVLRDNVTIYIQKETTSEAFDWSTASCHYMKNMLYFCIVCRYNSINLNTVATLPYRDHKNHHLSASLKFTCTSMCVHTQAYYLGGQQWPVLPRADPSVYQVSVGDGVRCLA